MIDAVLVGFVPKNWVQGWNESLQRHSSVLLDSFLTEFEIGSLYLIEKSHYLTMP